MAQNMIHLSRKDRNKHSPFFMNKPVNIHNFDPLITQIKKFLENESSGHDFYHVERVFKNALHIQKSEGGDFFIIGASALVHDVCRPWEKQTGKLHFGDEALMIIDKILEESKITPDQRKLVLDIVAKHDIYDWSNKDFTKSIELQVVQDADNLDAIGAIGIARTFAFGGANGLSLYSPGEKLDFTRDFVEDPNHRTSTIAHIYEKLLKLSKNMNTTTGKKLGQQRHKIMESFLKEFFNEWEGVFK